MRRLKAKIIDYIGYGTSIEVISGSEFTIYAYHQYINQCLRGTAIIEPNRLAWYRQMSGPFPFCDL